MPIPSKLPKAVNGDIPAGNAVGVGQLPPVKFVGGSPVTASQLRDISEQASRPNQLQRSMPGLNFAAFSGNPEFKMPGLFFEGILLEDMPASTDPLDDPVVVTMRRLRPTNHKVNTDQEALSFADIGDEFQIVNRRTDLSASDGDYVFCILLDGELRPMGGGGSSGGELIEFALSEVNCCTLTGTGTVRRVLCSGSGVSEGDTICLRDDSQMGYFFGGAHSPSFPAAWNGVRGWAAKTRWHSGEGGSIGSGSDCEDLCPVGSGSDSDEVCVWTVVSLMDTANYC